VGGTSTISAVGLDKSYGTAGQRQPVLRGASLDVAQGEWVAIMGPSGCGKSTLLHMLGGLDSPDAGDVTLDGESMSDRTAAERAVLRRRRVGYVFQQYNLVPHLDVTANIELPQRLVGASRKAARERTAHLLASLGLQGAAHALPATLSGGQQQRVAIARALANRPPLLLADEPTGALDSTAATQVMDLLRDCHDNGQTVVMVTHDHHVAAQADRVVLLRDGAVVGERALDDTVDRPAAVLELLDTTRGVDLAAS
jgi:putative ABC transport system ATP-binding protein